MWMGLFVWTGALGQPGPPDRPAATHLWRRPDVPTNVGTSKGNGRAGNLVPVYRSINADLETPVSAYLKVARPPYSYLLEKCGRRRTHRRYSFIGTDPYRVIKTGPGQPEGQVDPLTPVQEEMNKFKLIPVNGLPRFHGGAVGYLSYDSISYFEPRVPVMPADPQGLPESVFTFGDTMLVFDHLRHDIKVVSHAHLNGEHSRLLTGSHRKDR